MIPFVQDCYGGFGPEARSLVTTFHRSLVGQKEGWARRGAEADLWQQLSMTLAREVARQLRASCYVIGPDDDPLPGADDAIWAVPLKGRGGRGPLGPGGAHQPYGASTGAWRAAC